MLKNPTAYSLGFHLNDFRGSFPESGSSRALLISAFALWNTAIGNAQELGRELSSPGYKAKLNLNTKDGSAKLKAPAIVVGPLLRN